MAHNESERKRMNEWKLVKGVPTDDGDSWDIYEGNKRIAFDCFKEEVEPLVKRHNAAIAKLRAMLLEVVEASAKQDAKLIKDFEADKAKLWQRVDEAEAFAAKLREELEIMSRSRDAWQETAARMTQNYADAKDRLAHQQPKSLLAGIWDAAHQQPSAKCDCGHLAERHYRKEGHCESCGCTWYYPKPPSAAKYWELARRICHAVEQRSDDCDMNMHSRVLGVLMTQENRGEMSTSLAHQQPSAPTPDVESLLDNATHAILSMPKDRQTYEHYRADVERFYAQARAPLVARLAQMEQWLADVGYSAEEIDKALKDYGWVKPALPGTGERT